MRGRRNLIGPRGALTLLYDEQLVVDMRVICPLDGNKMCLKEAQKVNWRHWAAKFGCGESSGGVWLDPTRLR